MSSPPWLLAACLPAFLMASPVAHAAETLGRLFFTPEQRSTLDQQGQTESTREIQGNTLRLDGMVLRSSGRNTYWVNGQAQAKKPGGIVQGNVATQARRARAALPRHVRIGEAVNPVNGDKRALLEEDALRIHKVQTQ